MHGRTSNSFRDMIVSVFDSNKRPRHSISFCRVPSHYSPIPILDSSHHLLLFNKVCLWWRWWRGRSWCRRSWAWTWSKTLSTLGGIILRIIWGIAAWGITLLWATSLLSGLGTRTWLLGWWWWKSGNAHSQAVLTTSSLQWVAGPASTALGKGLAAWWVLVIGGSGTLRHRACLESERALSVHLAVAKDSGVVLTFTQSLSTTRHNSSFTCTAAGSASK